MGKQIQHPNSNTPSLHYSIVFMRRLFSSWLSFRPERAARYALLCGLVTLAALLTFLVCLCATAAGNETVVDRLFPYLVLFAPVGAICLALSLALGAFALVTSVQRATRRPLRSAYFSLTVALIALLTLGAMWRQPVPSRGVPPSLVIRRQFNEAQKLRQSIREVNWKKLHLFPPPKLSPQTVAQLRELKTRYEAVMKAQTDALQEERARMASERTISYPPSTVSYSSSLGAYSSTYSPYGEPTFSPTRLSDPSLRYWLGCVNALLGHYEEAMRTFTQPSRVPTPEGARHVRELWAELSENLARKTSPCEVALTFGNHEDAHLIATDPLADAYFARGRWREAVWRYERRLQVIYWRYRWTQPQIRYAPIPERVAQSYERWAESTPSSSLRRVLWERAAKASTNASRYETKRAGEFHLRAGECWLKAGYPWRALMSFEWVKKSTKNKSLHAQAAQGRQRAEANILNVGNGTASVPLTPSRIAERLKKFIVATKPFDDAERYFMAYNPDEAKRMLRDFMKKCPDPNDPLMDDALWHIGECEQSGIRYVKVQRKTTRLVTVKGKRVRRTFTYTTYQQRSRKPRNALPVLRELLQRFPQGDHRPEAIASIAQIDYYPHQPIEEINSYLALLRQYPDAPVVPKVVTLMWKAVQRATNKYKSENLLARLRLTNEEERQAINAVLRFHVGVHLLNARNYPAAARNLSEIDLTVPNRLLRAIADVSLAFSPSSLSYAAHACGMAYFYQRDWKNAARHFRRVLERPDVYNYHGWARYRLARCLENQGDWRGALHELAQVDFLESVAPVEESAPRNVAARWRINFILDAKLSRAQLEKHEADIRSLGLSEEWEMAMIARDLRDERLRDATQRIESFVVNHPHHPQARALWQRLCQLERNLIPTVEMSNAQRPMSNAPVRVVAWTRRLLRAQSGFKRKARLNLSGRHPMDEVLFEVRLSPRKFRAQRPLHRLVNRLSWHVRFWNAYGGAPNAERLAYDHAFYYAQHPLALHNYSGRGFNADVVFVGRWGTTFDPWDNPMKRWKTENATTAQSYVNAADSRVRAGRLFERFLDRYPHSRLCPRALLMALQSHHHALAVTHEASHVPLFLPLKDWQETFRRVKRDFALLRARYRGSREERRAAPLRCECQTVKEKIWTHISEAMGEEKRRKR